MEKLILIIALILSPLLTFAQMDEGEYFTGDFRPNLDCEFGWEGYTNFNKWKCLIPLERLPVTLISFTGTSLQPGVIRLNWKYENPVEHEFFILEHSTDAKSWVKLVNQTGTSYTHSTKDSENYYRLLSVDTDGTLNIYHAIYVKTKQEPVVYFDLLGRPVANPKPYQMVIGGGKKLMIVN